MKKNYLIKIIIAFVLILSSVSIYSQETQKPFITKSEIHKGMTKKEVNKVWGKPMFCKTKDYIDFITCQYFIKLNGKIQYRTVSYKNKKVIWFLKPKK